MLSEEQLDLVNYNVMSHMFCVSYVCGYQGPLTITVVFGRNLGG